MDQMRFVSIVDAILGIHRVIDWAVYSMLGLNLFVLAVWLRVEVAIRRIDELRRVAGNPEPKDEDLHRNS